MTVSNAIGEFSIGVSAIGDPAFPWQSTIMSQYANSPILLQLLSDFAQNVDATTNVDSFYDDVWNVETAQGWGLDFWGKIVGVGRVVVVSGEYFGFKEANDLNEMGWNQAPFYSGETLTSNYSLTDDVYRQLIYAKAATNITNCSIPAINAILRLLFGQYGVCYCTDGQNMTMQYVFTFTLSPIQVAIIAQSGALPKPTGVSVVTIESP